MSLDSKLSSGIESHSAFVSYMHSMIFYSEFVVIRHPFFYFNSGNLEVTVDFLTEIDQWVQLIESPIFACKYRKLFVLTSGIFNFNIFVDLRIELLEPEKNGPIVHTLYGLLMLLPQSEAFHTLRRRLECVAHLRPLADDRF
jgi:hypothetical protein